jgi:hypothetical protein
VLKAKEKAEADFVWNVPQRRVYAYLLAIIGFTDKMLVFSLPFARLEAGVQ